jgi:cytochrome c oxidase accessory protein FixG
VAFFNSEDGFKKKLQIFSLYSIFLFLSWILAHSLLAYFIGANEVMRLLVDGPAAHIQLFSVLMVITGLLFFNFTFFREKLCFYVCPYGRFQTALIDNFSLGVFYDLKRGEPRGKISKTDLNPKGDCIDCNRCVSVCPTKIDIRQGFQIECIACGKCIDACNEVMTKIKRPLGLIRYETGDQKPLTIKRFRIGLYVGLILIFALAFIYSLENRQTITFSLNRTHAIPFSRRIENNKSILQNQIMMHLKNQSNRVQQVQIELSPKDTANGFRLVGPALSIDLNPDQDLKVPAFLEIENAKFAPGLNQISINLKAPETSIEVVIPFVKVD